MKLTGSRMRFTAWITIAAMLAVLWSGLAHARVAVPGAPAWGDICSVAGTTQAPGGKNDGAGHVTHCAFCSKQDVSAVLPGRFDLPQPALALAWRLRPHTLLAAVLPYRWLVPHPRGPPRMS